jgi:hypothetical protein
MIRAKQIGSIKCPKCKQEVVRGQDQDGEWQLFDPETREIHVCKPKKPQDPAPEFMKGSQIPRGGEESRGLPTPTPPEVSGWVQADEKGEVVLFSGMGSQNTPKIILSELLPFVRFKVNIVNKPKELK